jgi:hypothetical protein
MSNPPEAARHASLPARWAVAFGRFWWDFLVGDTPELFVGTLLVIGIVAALVHAHLPRLAVAVAVPVLVAGLLVISLVRAFRTGRGAGTGAP